MTLYGRRPTFTDWLDACADKDRLFLDGDRAGYEAAKARAESIRQALAAR